METLWMVKFLQTILFRPRFEKKRIKIMSKWRYLSLFQGILLNGSVQDVFCSLRFRSNRFKHSVKRFDRFGLTTLDFTKYFFIEREFLFFYTVDRTFYATAVWKLQKICLFFSKKKKKLDIFPWNQCSKCLI